MRVSIPQLTNDFRKAVLERLLTELGTVVETTSHDAGLDRPCDVLVLAGGASVLEAHHAAIVAARVVVEAGGVVTPRADAALEARGVLVIPDVLTGVGFVTAGYLEWVQGLQQFFWAEREVQTQVVRAAVRAAELTLACAADYRVSLRTGALLHAVGRVANAIAVRGIYP